MKPETLATMNTPRSAFAVNGTPQRVEQVWVAAMPKEIAEDLFGLPADSLVTFFVEPGKITALMNLAWQSEEAKQREPGWFLELPPEMAAAGGFPVRSLLTVYAREGTLRVEVLPPPSPELKAAVERVLAQYGEAFEEMKRLGD